MLLISPLKMDGKQRAGVRDLIWSSVRWCVCACVRACAERMVRMSALQALSLLPVCVYV